MKATWRFAVISVSLLLPLGVVTAVLARSWWGQSAYAIAAWATFWSIVLSVLGYHSLRAALQETTVARLSQKLFGGILVRLVVLGLAHAGAYWSLGVTWTTRALVGTMILYAIGLFLEVSTLNRELRLTAASAQSGPTIPDSSTSDETTSNDKA